MLRRHIKLNMSNEEEQSQITEGKITSEIIQYIDESLKINQENYPAESRTGDRNKITSLFRSYL